MVATIGAYREGKNFAYPGWRLTVPGGPAGGHYKGFTHTQAAGTDLLPQDQYEQDREDGMSSHDLATASPLNPRGVYRSSAEVPPRPNASGAAMTYRGFQTARHAGTSVAPGSFPADYFDTPEDQFIPEGSHVHGMGLIMVYGADGGGVHAIGPAPMQPVRYLGPPTTGATSVVNQPQPTPVPLPPAQAVPVATAPPVSPTPAPIVATNEVVPLNDGSGNYVNLSTGAIVPASSVVQNPATGQLTVASTAFSTGLNWLEQSTIFAPLPNWGVLGAGLVAAMLLMGRKR
jgi:hypothetical protein